jgi:hypothetical protein
VQVPARGGEPARGRVAVLVHAAAGRLADEDRIGGEAELRCEVARGRERAAADEDSEARHPRERLEQRPVRRVVSAAVQAQVDDARDVPERLRVLALEPLRDRTDVV